MTRLFILMLISGFIFPVAADTNLFIDLVNQKIVTEKELEEAKKQIEGRQEIVLKENLSVNPFHHRVEEVRKVKKSFCFDCHLEKPHQANSRNRSFLNMHIDFISCETCHITTEKLEMDYRWLAFGYPATGQIINVSSSVHTMAEKVKTTIVPRPGAKIVPVKEGKPVLVFEGAPYSTDVKSQWKKKTGKDKARLKVKLHAAVNKKGHSCKACHDDQQKLLDFDVLGASDKQAHSITSNKIAHFFKRYKKQDERLKMSDLLR